MKVENYGSVSCSVKDYKGKASTVKMDTEKPTKAKAAILAKYLEQHSDAAVTSVGVSYKCSGDETDRGKYDRVEQKLVYLYETDKTGKTKRFSLPAPRDEDVNEDQEPESDTAEDVADMLKKVTGIKENLVYNGGGLQSRIPKNRSTKRTGI